MTALVLIAAVTALTWAIAASATTAPARPTSDGSGAPATGGDMAVTTVMAGRGVRQRWGSIWAERRHRRRVAARLPDAVELLVLAVQAGSPPAAAIRDVTTLVDDSIRPAFDAVLHRIERGRSLADAISVLPELLGPAAAPVADAITAADRYGTPLGTVLDGLAVDARDDRRRLAEAHARRLPVRLSFPLVTCTLPSFVLLAIVPALLGALSGLPASPFSP